jgi:hypothetical protein
MDWKNMNFSAKDVIAITLFLFSTSGVYYKVFYENENTKRIYEMQVKTNESSIRLINARIDLLENNLRTLQDDEIKRKVREEVLQEQQQRNSSK